MLKVYLKISERISQDEDRVKLRVGPLGGPLKTVYVPRHLLNPHAKRTPLEKYNHGKNQTA